MNFKERYSYNSQSDLLGVGGFSTIFLATDNLLGRKVALKFFPVESGKKYSVLTEIRRVINLDHPNIARFHDAVVLENINVHGEIDKIEIGVMEYMDGGDLKHFLSHNHCDPNQIGKLLYDILLGLEYLHEHGIIHRDLKPQNILVKNTPKGPVAKLTDFGISKASDAGTQTASTLLGSIEYMAPEQFNPAKFGIAGKIGTNVDLWGFGIMTYEILSGVALFGNRSSGQTTEQVMNNILQREITETDIAHLPDPWRSVIRVCIIKNANTRARTAHDLRMIIEQSMNSSASQTQYTSTGTTHNRNVPSPSNQTQVIGNQNVHEHQHVVNNPVHPHVPPLVQANQQSGNPSQRHSSQVKTEVVQHAGAGNHRSSTLSGSGQYVPPPSIQKKNIPVWAIIAGGCVLIALICLVAYLALRPEIAESVYEAEKQYEENAEDGLNSLRYLASSGNDSAYESLADIYYNEGQYDSAVFYFGIVGNSDSPRSVYYLMMLSSDEHLINEVDYIAAVRYAWLGDLAGISECTEYLNEFCEANNLLIDGEYNFYYTTTIGDQTWMAENLNVAKFRNGNVIRQATSYEEWANALANREPAWCYCNFDMYDENEYGKYYNWYALTDARELVPEGWHIPDNDEWNRLFEVGAYALKSESDWQSYSGPGDNSSGFNAKPSGELYYDYFDGLNTYCGWWSNSILEEDGLQYQYNVYIFGTTDVNGFLGFNESKGFPVRCVKNRY